MTETPQERKRRYARENARSVRRHRAMRRAGVELDTDEVSASDLILELKRAKADRGMTWIELERLSTVSRRTIWRISAGYQDTVQRGTERLIMDAIHSGRRDINPYIMIDIEPTRWQLRCLMAQGWTTKMLGERLGFQTHRAGSGQLSNMVNRNSHITFWLAQKVEALFLEIGDAKGPSSHTAARMHCRGHFPAIHYDENRKLIVSSLPPQLKAKWARVRSTHGKAGGRSDRA